MRNTVRGVTRGSLCALAGILALGVAACGSGDDGASTSSSGTTSATRPATPASPTEITGQDVCSLLDTNDLAPLT